MIHSSFYKNQEKSPHFRIALFCVFGLVLSHSSRADVADPLTISNSSVKAALEQMNADPSENLRFAVARQVINRETTLTQRNQEFRLDWDTVATPETEPTASLSYALGFSLRHGWTSHLDTSMELPRLISFSAETRDIAFFREVNIVPRYRVIDTIDGLPSFTVMAHLGVLNSGLAMGGGVLVEKKAFSFLRSRLEIGGRHRLIYGDPGYSVLRLAPDVGFQVGRLWFASFQMNNQLVFDPSRVHTQDQLGSYSSGLASTESQFLEISVEPKIIFSLTRSTDILARGAFFVNRRARRAQGDTVQLGIAVRI